MGEGEREGKLSSCFTHLDLKWEKEAEAHERPEMGETKKEKEKEKEKEGCYSHLDLKWARRRGGGSAQVT